MYLQDFSVSIKSLHAVLEWWKNTTFEVKSPIWFITVRTQLFHNSILEGKSQWMLFKLFLKLSPLWMYFELSGIVWVGPINVRIFHLKNNIYLHVPKWYHITQPKTFFVFLGFVFMFSLWIDFNKRVTFFSVYMCRAKNYKESLLHNLCHNSYKLVTLIQTWTLHYKLIVLYHVPCNTMPPLNESVTQ